jgi:hypothetical protein
LVTLFQEYAVNHGQQEHAFPFVDQCKDSPSGVRSLAINNIEGAAQLDYHQFDLPQSFEQNFYTSFNGTDLGEEDGMHHVSSYLPSMCPPPSAFLGPKCALWDCPRPAQGGLEWCQDYCSSFHHSLALNEGPPGMSPVLRPGGIGLKDGLLFAALSAKAEGKDVGIPECEGAATAKSPWNAPGMLICVALYLWQAVAIYYVYLKQSISSNHSEYPLQFFAYSINFLLISQSSLIFLSLRVKH